MGTTGTAGPAISQDTSKETAHRPLETALRTTPGTTPGTPTPRNKTRNNTWNNICWKPNTDCTHIIDTVVKLDRPATVSQVVSETL